MKNIITIQHAQSEQHVNRMIGCWTDWNLTDLGRQHADRIGRALKDEIGEQKYVMYSSDLKRAKQTAEIVGGHLGIAPILRNDIRELHVGIDTPTTREDYRKLITPRDSNVYDPDYKPLPNAESDRELWQRMNNFLSEIMESPDENIIVVSHSASLQCLFASWISDDFSICERFLFKGTAGLVMNLTIDSFGRKIIDVLKLNLR